MNYLTKRNCNLLSDIFDDIFFKDVFRNDFFTSLPHLSDKIGHPVDIYENDFGLVIDIAATGLDKSDIKIDIKDDILKVSHKKEEKTEEKKYAYRGISKKSFDLAWRVGDKFDISKTYANLDKGLLHITIPLAPIKKSNEIEVKIQ